MFHISNKFAFVNVMLKLCPLCHRYVFGVGITLWTWLKRMTQRGGVLHVVHLMIRKKLLGWLQTVRGGYSLNIVSTAKKLIAAFVFLFSFYFNLNFIAGWWPKSVSREKKARRRRLSRLMDVSNLAVFEWFNGTLST